MTTFSILAAFALMLLLPCAIAIFSNGTGTEEEHASDYSDRIVDQVRSRIDSKPGRSASSVTKVVPEVRTFAVLPVSEQLGSGDQERGAPIRRTQQDQILRNELELLLATAAAARTLANTLAANARLGAAKAESAEIEAVAAEIAASAAIQQMRRAA